VLLFCLFVPGHYRRLAIIDGPVHNAKTQWTQVYHPVSPAIFVLPFSYAIAVIERLRATKCAPAWANSLNTTCITTQLPPDHVGTSERKWRNHRLHPTCVDIDRRSA
jgi:hypothetical protein